MATITINTPISTIENAGLVWKVAPGVSPPSVFGLPRLAQEGRIRCSIKESQSQSKLNIGMGTSLMSAACAATMSSPALALVDERMSTEGTGLPFGLSSNLLGWILFGVFGLIWALYFVYTTGLEEDDDSGLSL